MKRLSLCLVLLLSACAASSQTVKPVLGIMPVFDSSGDRTGEIFVQSLAFMLFQEMRSSDVEPVLLNPGGLYNPLYPDWIAEFAESAHVSSVLVTTLQPLNKPKKGQWTVTVGAQLMNVASGKSGPVVTHSFSIDRREVAVEYGYYGGWFATGASRPFAKQPLGKGALEIARSIRTQVNAGSEYLVAGTNPTLPLANGICDVDFKVVYRAKSATSKSYDLLVNGKEESLGMKEGIVRLVGMKNGSVVVQVAVNDAPYKLTVQRLYQANDVVDCSSPERVLALEIGPAGEALLRWQ